MLFTFTCDRQNIPNTNLKPVYEFFYRGGRITKIK